MSKSYTTQGAGTFIYITHNCTVFQCDRDLTEYEKQQSLSRRNTVKVVQLTHSLVCVCNTYVLRPVKYARLQ